MTAEHGADRLTTIARGLDRGSFATVASEVLGGGTVIVAGEPRVVPLSAHHYDNRTVGMLHVTGQASDAQGSLAAWSCVIKVIDLQQQPRPNSYVDAANEVLIYRDRVFAGQDEAFRPARCYLISEGVGATTLLWLEDLTGLQKPPFTLEELDGMAEHLGAWDARQAAMPPALPFVPRSNSFELRWDRNGAVRQVSRLRELQEHRYFRATFRDVPLDAFDEFIRLSERLVRQTTRLSPSLCFGDCNVGNLFSGDAETVAVDWASVTHDPLGVDAGCLIGSAICWGRNGAAVAEEERGLFETYAAIVGSAAGGEAADIRRGYLVQYSFYVCFCTAMPSLLVDEVFPIPLVEQRFSARADEIPDLVAGVVARLPAYIAELEGLTGG